MKEPNKRIRIPRFDSIDIFRGNLICSMVIYHFTDWIYYPLKESSIISGSPNQIILLISLIAFQMGDYPLLVWVLVKENFFGKLFNIIGYLITAPFMVIVGISLTLSVAIRKERGQDDKKIRNHIIMRFLWLNIFNLLLAQIVLGPGTLFMIGALSVIAFNVILGYFLMKLSKYIKAVLAVLIYVFSPIIRHLLNIPKLGYYTNTDPVFGGVLSVLVNLMAQYLPILSVTLFGMILGEFLIEFYRKDKLHHYLYLLVGLGVFFLILGCMVDPYSKYFGFMYILGPLENHTIFYSLAYFCLGFAAVFLVIEIKKIKVFQKLFQLLKLTGSVTLTIFFFHHFLGLAYFNYYNHPFTNYFNTFSYIEIWLGIYLLMWVFLSLWSKVKYKYSLEWILQKYS